MAYMVQAITAKLKMVNTAALQSSQFSIDHYDDLFDLYEMVMKKIHSARMKCKLLWKSSAA